MIAPDLLQPVAEIGNVIECRPVVSFAECNQPADERFESAKIQSKKEPANGRQGDGQHHEGHGREPVRAGEIQHDTDPGRHKDQEAHDLDKNVDENAGNCHICGDAELGQ